MKRGLLVAGFFSLLVLIASLRSLPRSRIGVSYNQIWWSDPSGRRDFEQCSWWNDLQHALPGVSNGYIIVDCNGGLNQMRRDFCDGVGVARLLNATLLLPQFEGTPYWNDSSGFSDIFDADFFIETMKGYVRVVKELPPPYASKKTVLIDCQKKKLFDYVEAVLPVLLKEKVVIIRPAASQRSDRYPLWAKASRCQACYKALRLVQRLENTAQTVLDAIPRPFLALHLRFEPDMIAYSRCTYSNLSKASLDAIEAARDNKAPFTGSLAESWRNRGKCPLTPGEAAFVLQALRVPTTMPIYLASGSGLLEETAFSRVYPNIYRKLAILGADALKGLHGNSKAALDYYVAVHSDIYVATYFGNMDKMVVAMRAMHGSGKTLVLNRQAFATSVSSGLSGAELAQRMWEVHSSSLFTGRNLPLPDCFCRSTGRTRTKNSD
ncbi:O-fucosyltransferase 13 isoform X2 [Selaginella moellendorffii]|uniref:O-fucosyltransferase 13 isoform X2 n=1 Tax=Selaginella moellendorffii TaxID=88036 RepID=UPI000D1CB3F5|nr:O-fucosyltransferase 13 isoform X2 [Selaginella moellendorffii]|eukprot:XP_024514851.1 O-fucosyltransferase 13 isoform X2 [Selaginella moellendorffii]